MSAALAARRPGPARAIAVALAAACVLGAAAGPARPAWAQPAAPTRAGALRDLRSADADERRRAAAALGDLGTMADVPALVQSLRDDDPLVRAFAHQSLWEVWGRSGDAETDRIFRTGLEQMSGRAWPAAIETFSRVIARSPDFAEGWNKRATVYYLAGEYEKSLRDCDEVMKRNPHHFGALSGYGQIYLRLGQPEKALPYLERALAINPNLDLEATIEQLRTLILQRKKDTI